MKQFLSHNTCTLHIIDVIERSFVTVITLLKFRKYNFYRSFNCSYGFALVKDALSTIASGNSLILLCNESLLVVLIMRDASKYRLCFLLNLYNAMVNVIFYCSGLKGGVCKKVRGTVKSNIIISKHSVFDYFCALLYSPLVH